MGEADIDQYRAHLARQRRRARLWGRVHLGLAVLSGLILLLVFASDDPDDVAGGLFLILTAVFAIVSSRHGLRVEALERSLNEFDILLPDEGLSDGDRTRQRLILAQKNLTLSRDRALNGLVYAILFLGIGGFVAVYVGASLPDFLSRYHGGEAGTPFMESYESELLGGGFMAVAFLAWGTALLVMARSARRDAEHQEVERELMRFRSTEHGAQARKLFLLNGYGLERYYEVNRFNNRLAMGVSVLCILGGIGVTVWTITLVLEGGRAEGEVLVAAVGAANAIMVNVVAAIVLRMQGAIWANVDSFHQRLVRTHELFLANVIAADLEDPDLRQKALAEVATLIGAGQGARAAPQAARPAG